MARQYRWFWGVVLTACVAVLIIGIEPFSQASLGVSASNHHSEASRLVAQSTVPEASNVFTDPANQYAIALLDGFKAHSIAGQSVFESADGTIAYSVIVAPTLSTVTLTDAALAQMAQVTFQQGERFVAHNFQPLTSGGIKIDWTGQVTTQKAEPLSGTIFAQQVEDNVFLLMIAATEAGQEGFAEVIATLPSSLRPLSAE